MNPNSPFTPNPTPERGDPNREREDQTQLQLEVEIDRELKSLPEIPAPLTLIVRVMQAIARRQALPWFRRAWQTWPVSLQVISFATLALLFTATCLGAWDGATLAIQKYGSVLSVLGTLWTTITVLFGALVTAVNQLPRGVLIGCLGAIVLGYTMCAAMGTFAFALLRNPQRFNNYHNER
jgi:hypothetical protein